MNITSSTGRYPWADELLPTMAATDRGDGEKILAMATLGLGSFLAGMLPAFISERNRNRFPLTTSLLLCFGAGVLLATAMVHILPEVRAQMASRLAEVSLCAGFFIIYFIDEFIHYFFGEAIQHSHAPPSTTAARRGRTSLPSIRVNGHEHSDPTPSYGATRMGESAPLLRNEHSHHDHTESGATPAGGHSHCDPAAIEDANARICHTSHTEPCAESMTGTLGLFVALSLHSSIEGLAIGVQNTATKVLVLLGAVACHKFVMVFCLGLEFRSNPRTMNMRSHLCGIGVFTFGVVAGIGLGMIIVDMPSSGWLGSALPLIQALAGGTLFYVTVCEVMPREKARWHQNPTRKAAGFAQFFAVLVGFVAMCLVTFYLDDDDQ